MIPKIVNALSAQHAKDLRKRGSWEGLTFSMEQEMSADLRTKKETTQMVGKLKGTWKLSSSD